MNNKNHMNNKMQFFDGPPLEKLAPLGGSALHAVKSVGARVL